MADTVETKILMRFEARTKDAERKIKQLEKQNTKLAGEIKKGSDSASSAIDKQIAMWGKVAVGIAAAAGAYHTLKQSAEKYAKFSQAQHAAVGADIGKIQKAAKGLISEYEALSFAAAALNTDFKLSQKEMEEVSKFMVVLRNQNNDFAEVQREVTKAIVEGNVEGLKKFGVVMNGIKPGMDAHIALMERIRSENRKAGDDILLAGDSVQIAGKRFDDSLLKIQLALGRVAVALTPVVEAMAELAGLIGSIANADFGSVLGGYARVAGYLGLGGGAAGALESANSRRSLPTRLARGLRRGAGITDGTLTAGAIGSMAGRGTGLAQRLYGGVVSGLGTVAAYKAPGPGRGRGGGTDNRYRDYLDSLRQSQQPTPGTGAGFSGQLPGQLGAPMDRGYLGSGSFVPSEGEPMVAQQAKSFQQIVEGSSLATNSMAAFQQAGVAAFAALIDGSESFSKAFRKALGSSLMGMSMQMTAEALKEGVFALGSLAIGDPKGAAVHGTAAVKAGIAAGVIGVMAHELGAGGAGGRSGAVPAGGAGAFAGSGANSGSNTTIFVGSDFGDNPRANASRLSRAFQRARELEGDDSVVVFS